MTGALSRLMVVAENYPNLKADASFRDLQAQLEGTENRITVARNRYIESVRDFNVQGALLPLQPDRQMAGHAAQGQFLAWKTNRPSPGSPRSTSVRRRRGPSFPAAPTDAQPPGVRLRPRRPALHTPGPVRPRGDSGLLRCPWPRTAFPGSWPSCFLLCLAPRAMPRTWFRSRPSPAASWT